MMLLCAFGFLIQFLCASSNVVLQFGKDMTPSVASRVEMHIRSISYANVTVIEPTDACPQNSAFSKLKDPFSMIVLSFGNTTCSRLVIDPSDLARVGPEGFVGKSWQVQNSLFAVVAGNPSISGANNGLSYGAYELLEQLGFAFFHPLQPTVPSSLQWRVNGKWNVFEKPYWPFRGWHIHTEHPLELTNFLNGFGTNMSTSLDEWKASIPEWESVLEWLLANKQNRVEWVLLWAEDWQQFAEGSERQSRLQQIVSLCHQYGILAGADIPIANEQQHAWYMTSNMGTFQEQVQRIQKSIDYIAAVGFDFLATENGYSEFTHPNDVLMLSWINATVEYISDKYNKPAYIKVHCSTGQTCPHYKTPWNGQPLNFNFLPIYADKRLGLYPHTVQVYTFDDPTSGTYGNQNFTYMYDFMTHEISKRELVYHGETAYWVNYDIDVPLFLPVYTYGRLYDLRKIARLEKSSGYRMQGQMNFDSGWEWGYWLNDIITARLAWNPLLNDTDDMVALKDAFTQISFVFGDAGSALVDILMDYITFEHQVLVNGQINGQQPSNTMLRNGFAYLEGWDTWSEIGCAFTTVGCTQPPKLGLDKVRIPGVKPDYKTQVRPLLQLMATNLTAFYKQIAALESSVPTNALPLYNDIAAVAQMTALRANVVLNVYEYASSWMTQSKEWRKQRIADAVSAIETSLQVVADREENYRVPVERIAGWDLNPTCYTYGYLWTVHSQFYNWRDLGVAMMNSIESVSPCYQNIISPVDVAFGEGITLNLTEIARKYLDSLGMLDTLGECLAAPDKEPHYSFPPP